MNDSELAWVAGFLEGEGCFHLMKCNKGRFGIYYYPRISCTSTDLDALQRLQACTRIGGIAGPRQRGTDKPKWDWTASRSQQAIELMEAIYPYMGERRQARIDEILDYAGRSWALGVDDQLLDHFSWVVGYLEGEGAFYYMTFQTGKYGPYYYPRVRVGCTDSDVIEWLPRYTGLGQITGPYHRKPPLRTVWYWTITRRDDAVAFMEFVRPLMCSRRQARITEVLGACGPGTVRRRSPRRLEFIDLVPIEEGKLVEGQLEEAGEARLYDAPLQTPSQPEKGRR